MVKFTHNQKVTNEMREKYFNDLDKLTDYYGKKRIEGILKEACKNPIEKFTELEAAVYCMSVIYSGEGRKFYDEVVGFIEAEVDKLGLNKADLDNLDDLL